MKNDLYPYPVETLKHWYVTIVGGQSMELRADEIGVNKAALAENTDIVPYEDNILISRLEGGGAPLFTKKYFMVVPLDEASPDASFKSPKGEVVLPMLDRKRFLEPLKIGEPVILNNVLSRRYPGGFVRGIDGLIKKRSGRASIEYRDN